jgi:pimeloyl-ACP methyl ester carboxylesterase
MHWLLPAIGDRIMRKGIVAALVCTISLSAPVQVRSTPSAVIADPRIDPKFPPGLVGTTVPSHGVDMDATLYLAGGEGMHGTVLLLHGLPGYETNGDLAQSIRRAGWNVLMFHYRGTWGVGGTFSLSSAIEDTAAAVRFLRDPANVAKYRLHPQRLVVVGHSVGGFLAGFEGGHDPRITAVAMISAVNLGKINGNAAERDLRLQRWESQLHPVRGVTAAALFAEAARHAQDWNYVEWADALRSRAVLLVEADDQNRDDMEALAAALHRSGAAALDRKAIATDHSFSDHRIALQALVVGWLEAVSRRVAGAGHR